MARDKAYREAEQMIRKAKDSGASELRLSGLGLTELPESLLELPQLTSLRLYSNKLKRLPEWLGKLGRLQTLDICHNQVTALPDAIGDLEDLRKLVLGVAYTGGNPLGVLPPCVRRLRQLRTLYADECELQSIPEWIGELSELEQLDVQGNALADLPPALGRLEKLTSLDLKKNPLNPELAALYKQGVEAVKQYLRERTEAQVALYEAKLILVGEGEVGKSCLLGALRGDPWIEKRDTTHGIEIKPVTLSDPDSGTKITLNGWDFGGQRVYRPTHQLFFSAPAVYLVVWKPREGPQQGFVKEWLTLVRHRAPTAKVLVVATHGGPGQRQPDIRRQEILDLFGEDMVLGFHHVDSRPDPGSETCPGLDELKAAIARATMRLPEMGREVPARWQIVRAALKQTRETWLSYEGFLAVCKAHGMDEQHAQLFARISHTLGHLIHYDHDPLLRDVVILKPDWLATAISFVLDDKETRDNHGLVETQRLNRLWNDPARPPQDQYEPALHPVFLRLMERFDLSYRIALDPAAGSSGDTSLIAQLVPDNPERVPDWEAQPGAGDVQQVQICRIVDEKHGRSETAEGLFYQLIVRLHKYSLGRRNYSDSVHWQHGLMLDDDYNGRALLDQLGNDVRITVRAAYPERFLSVLTSEVKWLVATFWKGLRCEVMVPCIEPCGKGEPGLGLFEVQKLIAFKKQGMTKFPCLTSGCSQLQDIDWLLRNEPSVQRTSVGEMLAERFDEMRSQLTAIREQLKQHDREELTRFEALDRNDRRILSQVDDAFTALMQALTDEAKDGPRLFSLEPVAPGFFDRPAWLSEKFRLTLWCEHSRLPLPQLNGGEDRRGVYDLTLAREWLVKAAPLLKVLTGTLSLALPIAASATKLLMDDQAYARIEKGLDFGQRCFDSVLVGAREAGSWLERRDAPDWPHGEMMRAQGAILRELHVLLKEKDPGFGGLARVQNKQREFLWVHPQFAGEY